MIEKLTKKKWNNYFGKVLNKIWNNFGKCHTNYVGTQKKFDRYFRKKSRNF